MKLPDYIIIGETKCGTTSLYNYLIEHPRVLDTYGNGIDNVSETYKTKEIRYFDRYFDKGLEWYMKCFPDTSPGEVTGEATPMYMYRTMAMFRIKKALPDTKFIILLRNPVDRLYSHFNHYFNWVPGWKEKYGNFNNFINSAHETDYYMIDKGIYINSIRRWFSEFEPERFLILKTEDLYEKTQDVYAKAIKFLGIVEGHELKEPSMFRTQDYEPMDNSTRRYLEDFYHKFNKELYDFIGRDMGWESES